MSVTVTGRMFGWSTTVESTSSVWSVRRRSSTMLTARRGSIVVGRVASRIGRRYVPRVGGSVSGYVLTARSRLPHSYLCRSLFVVASVMGSMWRRTTRSGSPRGIGGGSTSRYVRRAGSPFIVYTGSGGFVPASVITHLPYTSLRSCGMGGPRIMRLARCVVRRRLRTRVTDYVRGAVPVCVRGRIAGCMGRYVRYVGRSGRYVGRTLWRGRVGEPMRSGTSCIYVRRIIGVLMSMSLRLLSLRRWRSESWRRFGGRSGYVGVSRYLQAVDVAV